jgi:hypothetical protein
MLTLGTVTVAAGVITVLKLLTVGTTVYLTAQALGAAMLNRPHRLTMRRQKFVRIFFSVICAVLSKEVSQF